MVSIESVKSNLRKEATNILILMQESDTSVGFEANFDWADEMFDAHNLVMKAMGALSRAQLADK